MAEAAKASGNKEKVALYVRVSTREQALEGYSLEGQIDDGKVYIEKAGKVLFRIYKESGRRGQTLNRPAYLHMMNERDEWDSILVWKRDRIHRSLAHLQLMLRELKRWGKTADSMTDLIWGDSLEENLIITILGAFDEYEVMKRGLQSAFGLQKGFVMKEKDDMGQKAAFGFKWSNPGPRGNAKLGSGELIQVPKEAEIVKKIFDWSQQTEIYMQRNRYRKKAPVKRLMGYGRMARKLNWCTCKRKLVHRKFRKKGEEDVPYSAYAIPNNCTGCGRVRRIVDNPAVAGYLRFSGVIRKGKYQPIISRETFETVQRLHHRVEGRRVLLPDDEFEVQYDWLRSQGQPSNYRRVKKE